MNPEWEEKKFKALFDELKQFDERSTPSFAQFWAEAVSHRGRTKRIGFRIAAAFAALVLVFGALVVLMRPFSHTPLPETREMVASISGWHSPTDFLLQVPGNQLLKNVPHLGDTELEMKSIMPYTITGTRRDL